MATEALALVRSDPIAAMNAAMPIALDEGTSPTIRSRAFRAAGLAARHTGTIDQSIDLLRQAMETVGDIDEPAYAEAALSLSGSLALGGQVDDAVDLLQRHRPSDRLMSARFDFQLATIHARQGRTTAAIVAYDRALPVFEEADDLEFVAITLANRGRAHLELADLDGAGCDLAAARTLHQQQGQDASAAYVTHNLGELALVRGDLQSALLLLGESADELTRLTHTPWEPQVARGEALLAAGLFEEAARLASELVHLMGEASLHLDRAEAQLLLARAQLRLDDRPAAGAAAGAANEIFTEQGRDTWSLRSRAVQVASETNSPHKLRHAMELVADLEAHNAPSPMLFEARSIACRTALAVGDRAAFDRNWSSLRRTGSSRMLDEQLTVAMLAALEAADRGATRSAFAAVRRALDLGDRHQTSLAALELFMAGTWNTAEVAQIGVRLALRSGDPRVVFRHVERSRALSHRRRAVGPSDNPELADLAATVRSHARTLSTAPSAELARDFTRAAARLREVERRVHTDEVSIERSPDLAQLRAAIGQRTVLSLFEVDGRLIAQVIERHRSQLMELGSVGDAETRFARVTRRLDALGRGVGDTATVEQMLDDWSEWKQLPIASSSEVVLVPPRRFMSSPWALLEGLRDRPLTVTPSAHVWLRGMADPCTVGSAAVLTGPDVPLAEHEAGVVSAEMGASVGLTAGPRATVEGARGLFETVNLLHVVCHAAHRPGNPLFSAFELFDGPLMLIELERLRRVPTVVVLSSCRGAVAEPVGAGEEVGLATMLLRLGARCVLASPGLVPDSHETVEVVRRFHRSLRSGRAPAQALMEARQSLPEPLVAAAAFTVYGSSPDVRWAERPA